MWAVTALMWAVTASMYAVTVSMWDVAISMWVVTASTWTINGPEFAAVTHAKNEKRVEESGKHLLKLEYPTVFF